MSLTGGTPLERGAIVGTPCGTPHTHLQDSKKDKLDTKWEHGVFAGAREESGELHILSEKGSIKRRSFNRHP